MIRITRRSVRGGGRVCRAHALGLRFMCVTALAWPFVGCNDDAPGSEDEDGDENGDESGEAETGTDTGDAEQVFVLADGTEVHVGPDGGVEIVAPDGRRTIAIPAGAGPIGRTFNESAVGPFAIWSFTRTSEQASAYAQLDEAGQDNGVVALHYADDDGNVGATIEIAPGAREHTTHFRVTLANAFDSLALPLVCDDEGSFYGFGAQFNQADQFGEAFTLMVSEQGIGRDPDASNKNLAGNEHTTSFPMPYYLDARGFGVLLGSQARVDVDLCNGDGDIAWFEVVHPDPIDLTLFHGPSTKDVITQLGAEVGRPKAPPAWAYETWIGAQGGSEAVLAEMNALEAAEIPFGVLWVQDWTGPRMNFDGGIGVQYRWEEDPEHYPDLAGVIAQVHDRGHRFLSYVNPFVDMRLQHWPEMVEGGYLMLDEAGEPYDWFAPNGRSGHPDLTIAASREYVKDHFRRMVTELGMDGWMADFGEWVPLDVRVSDGTAPIIVHNTFPTEWHALSREVMDELRPDGDWVVFARSGNAGVQRVSMVHWLGDQQCSFSPYDGLPTVVPGMLNLGLSGVPFVTHDIAGFAEGPSTKELWLRWTELGAFTPIMRTHEGAHKDENWSWEKDEETTAHFRRFVRIHDALAPEIMLLAEEAAETSVPIVRHLMLEFPEDAASRIVDDQYMLGPSLLVAPVVDEGATTRSVYLPPGQWWHVFTGDEYQGGQRLAVDAPVGVPPVFSLGADRPDLRAIE